MNKKEIAEIRKQLKPKSAVIQDMRCFYVSSDKKLTETTVPKLSQMDEDESSYYFNIFRKSISGSIGKQLHTLVFPNEAEKDGHPQANLMEIRTDKLKNEDAVQNLCQSIVNGYSTDADYCIVLAYGVYDIPTKNKMGDFDDESDCVYRFILGSICPIAQSKPCIAYNLMENELENSSPIKTVAAPDFGFLFPAFNDRNTDIHEVLTYAKKASDDFTVLYDFALGCEAPMSQSEQVSSFAQITKAAFGEDCSFTDVANVQMSLFDLISEKAESGHADDLSEIDQKDLRTLLEDNQASEMDEFEKEYKDLLGSKPLTVENIVDPKKFVVKTGDIAITGSTASMQLISTKKINGVPYIVINPNGGEVELNGVSSKL